MKCEDKKAQVTIYFLSIMATLIGLAFIVINVGKTTKDKTHADNAADAGALAACSVMAQGFNYVAQQNGDGKDPMTGTENMQNAANKYNGQTGGPTQQTSQRALTTTNSMTNNAQSQAATRVEMGSIDSHIDLAGGDVTNGLNRRKNQANKETEIDSNKQVENMHQDEQQRRLQNAKKAMDGDGSRGNNYADNAISQGYKICFQNAGVHHRLGRLTSKMYEQFQKMLEPGVVQSGVPMTFFWVDGAARAHMVTCIIQTERPDNWQCNESQDNRAQTEQKYQQENAQLASAKSSFNAAKGGYTAGKAAPRSIDWTIINPATDGLTSSGQGSMDQAQQTSQSITQGLQNQKQGIVKQSSQAQTETVDSVQNIIHSQTVLGMNFQFHMGSPIKSINGDIDVMTFYPPVQSSAIATFNYTGRGKIHREGRGTGSDANYECGLIGAF